MIKNKDTKLKVAEFLLQIKAIKLQPQKPFTWASGWKSPIYCDNRVILSYPKVRTYIRQEFSKAIIENFDTPDIIAGVATGGIAHGALVAQELNLPFIYVRSEAKKHGLTNVIEGYFEPKQNVVVIEDLISTGKSSLNVVKSLREAGCIVKGMAAIFTYGFKVSEESFAKEKCPLITLTNYQVLIEQAFANGVITENQIESLNKWSKAPDKWGA
ncbi:MAG: orotate phosphoribosyltransferase [Bacteroidales bacterium]|nr:orotate phosphoribosyltransferase [Bacteroidales bacterium]